MWQTLSPTNALTTILHPLGTAWFHRKTPQLQHPCTMTSILERSRNTVPRLIMSKVYVLSIHYVKLY